METQTQPTPRRDARRSLLLHCGAEIVTRDEVKCHPTPESAKTWYPLSHHALLKEVEGHIMAAGFDIVGEAHAFNRDGAHYFGVLEIGQPDDDKRDYRWIAGLRNSHDKTYPAGLAVGSRVLCCDNLSFSGEIKISRKHTRFAERDLKHLTAKAVGRLGEFFYKEDNRIEAYRNRALDDPRAHDLVIKAVDCRAITPSQIPGVLKAWREPQHEQFRDRNAWSLFNAFTETQKGSSPSLTIARTQALHGLFDGLIGLN